MTLYFDLASSKDDAQLRRRMANDSMPGSIVVSFRREPDFFLASSVQGENAQIIKCVDSDTGRIIGLGSRLTRRVYIDGKERRIGYLSDLRIDAGYRNGTGLYRGYKFLKQLHSADTVPFYYSMILEENHIANNILASGRKGLPIYRNVGRFCTPAIYLDVPKKPVEIAGIQFRKANISDKTAIFSFMDVVRRGKQFAPVYTESDMGTPLLRGLNIEDFYLAEKGDKIVGIIAAWDQTAFRQTVVERYSLRMRVLKPAYNAISKISFLKPLPAAGDRTSFFYLALVSISDGDVNLFDGLLRYLYLDRRKGAWQYFIAGFPESDPFMKVIKRYRRIEVAGRLYLVCYPEQERYLEKLDCSMLSPEIASI